MSDVVEKDVREIKYKVEAIEKSVDLLVRANRREIIEDLMIFFGKSRDRVKVFVAIDGEKSVNQIADEIKVRPQNVSRRLTELEREGLIRLKRTDGASKVYEKTEKVAILNLEKVLGKALGPENEPSANDQVEEDVRGPGDSEVKD
jgi:DNA-binding transcriptional ArsR family regulator